jgi:hypothetical protein
MVYKKVVYKKVTLLCNVSATFPTVYEVKKRKCLFYKTSVFDFIVDSLSAVSFPLSGALLFNELNLNEC